MGDEFETAVAADSEFDAYCYEVFRRGIPFAVDGSGMFAVVSFGAEGKVVGRGKTPCELFPV